MMKRTGRQQKCCRVETVLFQEKDRNTMTLPQLIFERQDLALVAAGSVSCTRALYMQAVSQKKLHQFYWCCTAPGEYASGSSVRKLKKELEKALQCPGTGGVILYASCMEVITKLDFENLRDSLNNIRNIPVEILYRGPMVARYQTPAENLEKIIHSIPKTDGRIEPGRLELPPVLPDFAGIAHCLQKWDTYNFLVGAGGCTGCMTALPGSIGHYRLQKSRLNDVEAAMGCEALVQQGIVTDCKDSGKKMCCVLGTAVPELLGLDYEQLLEKLSEKGISSVYLKSDGFHSAAQGIAEAYLTLGKKWIVRQKQQAECIGVLGAHALCGTGREMLDDGVFQLRQQGYQICFPEEYSLEEWSDLGASRMNWVVSAEGILLAQWMQEKFKIPYIAVFPVGLRAELRWLDQIRMIMAEACGEVVKKRDSEKINAEENPSGQEETESAARILLIGDPIVTAGLRDYFEEELGCSRVVQAIYAPLPSMKGRCQDIVYFRTREELEELVQAADTVVGDRFFQELIPESTCGRMWIDVPEPMLTMGIRQPMQGCMLFGEKGAVWLEEQMKR